MGDPAMYPEIRSARNIYALQRLPRDFTDDVQARKQWVDNNLTYLDGLVIADLHYHDADFRRASWSTYQNLHMCRLGVCPNWLWTLDVCGLSTPTAIIHSCPVCFNPQLPNPQIYPARSIAQASAQFQVRDPTVEREGPVVPLYGPFDCWQNPQTTPLTHLLGLPVHPTNIPLAPMYPPEFNIPPPEPPEP
eukprot:scaffold7607_cov104-Isochrysis_galbana.AAC.1